MTPTPPTAKTAPSSLSRLFLGDRLELVSQLTLALLLLHAPKQWYIQGPLTVLCIAGLAFAWCRQLWQFWFLVFAFLASSVYFNWATSDNHKYLECYWVLAIACVLGTPPGERRRVLAVNARLLIGLCMLLATGWKVATPSYRSGDFFEYTMLTDDRFEDLAAWVGDVPLAVSMKNRTAERVLLGGYADGIVIDEVQLQSTPAMKQLAFVMTWWTVFIEGLLALLFLRRGGKAWRITADVCLILFAGTTYLIATVKGFGWLLVIMGLAQSEKHEEWIVPLYVAVFFAIQLYTMPYAEAGGALLQLVNP